MGFFSTLFAIIIGTIIGLVVGYVIDGQRKPLIWSVLLPVIFGFSGWLFSRSILNVPPASVGVIYLPLHGGIQKGVTIGEGFNFVSPLAETKIFSIQTQQYTMSHIGNEGNKEGDDSIICQTNEGLQVSIDATANYRVDPARAPFLWANLVPNFRGIEAVVIRPFLRREIRMIVAKYSVNDVYSGLRLEIQNEITKELQPIFDSYGIILDEVRLRDVRYANKAFEEAITQKQIAQQRVATEQRNLQAAYNTRDGMINEARGDYNAMMLRANALKQNPEYIQYEMASKLGPKIKHIYMEEPFSTGKRK